MTNLISLSDAAGAVKDITERPLSFEESLNVGGSVIVFGLAIVFMALVSLILITNVYPKIVQALARKAPKDGASSEARKSARKSETVSAAPAAAAAQPADDTALIAVITAAVAASLGTSSNGIVIRSLSRARQNIPAWGKSGRTEQIFNRF